MLTLATKECYFLFNEKVYKQLDGVAMGSPLGPTLANIFMSHFENTFLGATPRNIAPKFYRRYVDDILVGFEDPSRIQPFLNYYNSLHKNIKFTVELEKYKRISFLDINLEWGPEGLQTSTHHKKTATGLLTRYDSFLHDNYKNSLIFCLLFRAFKICSTAEFFMNEVRRLKILFRKNKYPSITFDKEFVRFKQKYIDVPTVQTVAAEVVPPPTPPPP